MNERSGKDAGEGVIGTMAVTKKGKMGMIENKEKDDKLGQARWIRYQFEVVALVSGDGLVIFFRLYGCRYLFHLVTYF